MSENTSTGLGRELATLYLRELDRAAALIEAYDDEDELWTRRGDQKNSPGTLALHMAGNLLHYVGAQMGGTGYVRDRDAEFGERTTKEEALRRLAETRDVVGPVIGGLSDEELAQEFPGDLPPVLEGMSTRSFLVHLLWHLGWHQGHVYYHKLAGPSQ